MSYSVQCKSPHSFLSSSPTKYELKEELGLSNPEGNKRSSCAKSASNESSPQWCWLNLANFIRGWSNPGESSWSHGTLLLNYLDLRSKVHLNPPARVCGKEVEVGARYIVNNMVVVIQCLVVIIAWGAGRPSFLLSWHYGRIAIDL